MSSSSELPELDYSESDDIVDGYLDDDGAQAPFPQEPADFLSGVGFTTGFFSNAARPARPASPRLSDFVGRGTASAAPLPPTVVSTAQLRALQEQLNLDDYDDMDEGSDYAPDEPWDGVDEVVEQIMADMEAQLDLPGGLAQAPGLGPSENLSRMLAQLLGLGPGLGGPTAGGAGLGGLDLAGLTELRVPELGVGLGGGGDAAAAAAAAERRHALNMLDWGFPTAADPARHAALAAEGVPAGRMERAAPREAPIQSSSAASFRQPRPAEFPPGHPFRRLGGMPIAQPAPRDFFRRAFNQRAGPAAGAGFNPDEPPGLTSSDDEWDLPAEPARHWRRPRAAALGRGGGGSGGGAASAAQARAAAARGAGAAAAAGLDSDGMPELMSDDDSSLDESEGSDGEVGGSRPPASGPAPRQGAQQPRQAPTRATQPGSAAAAAGPARQRPQQPSRVPAAPRAARTRVGGDDSDSPMPPLLSDDDDMTDSDYLTDGEDVLPAFRDAVFSRVGPLSGRQGGAQQPAAQQAGRRPAAQQGGQRPAAPQTQRDPLGEAMQRFMAQQGARRQQAGQQPAAQQAGQQAQQRAARPRRNAIFGALPGLGGHGGSLPAELLLGREAAGSGASAAGRRSAGDADSDMPPLLEPDTDGSESESGDSEHGRSGYLDSSGDEGSEAGGRGGSSGSDDALPPLIDSDEDSVESGEGSEQMPGQGSGGSEAAGEAAAAAAEEAALLEVLDRQLGSMHGSEDEGGDDGMPELEPMESSGSEAAGDDLAEGPGAAFQELVVPVPASSASPSPVTAPAPSAAASAVASSSSAAAAAAAAPAGAAEAETQECNPEEAAQQAAGSAGSANQPVSLAMPQADSLAIGTAPPALPAAPAVADAAASQKRHQLHGRATAKQHSPCKTDLGSSEQHSSSRQQHHARLGRLPGAGLELVEPALESAAALEAAVQPQPAKGRMSVEAGIPRAASGASDGGAQLGQSASSSVMESASKSNAGLQQLSLDESAAAADGGLADANERSAAVAEPAAPAGEPAAAPPRTAGPSSVVGRVVGAGSNFMRWFSGGRR